MALTDIERIRYKTTLNATLLPDAVISDLIDENTVSGELDFNAAVADVFEYMAAVTGEGNDVKSWTRGQMSMVFASTLRDIAQYYRSLSGTAGAGIVMKKLTRDDWASGSGAQY